jgi:hypothetical protein
MRIEQRLRDLGYQLPAVPRMPSGVTTSFVVIAAELSLRPDS